MMNKGLIQVYTGNGKGKTTAAVGLCVRAIAHKMKVGFIYFHKEPSILKYGEHRILKKLGIDIFGFAEKHPCFSKDANKTGMRNDCIRAIGFIKHIFKTNKYNLLVLDEILISVRDGFLKENELLDIVTHKPKKLELILTGRGVTKKIIEKAGLVSEIKKIKHPYDAGITARKGMEY